MDVEQARALAPPVLDAETAPADVGGPLTYADYLRVPELLALQSPLAEPPVPDELLFILVQQVQELWFKQLLHDLGIVIRAIDSGELFAANRLLARVNRLLWLLGEEAALLETLPPGEFLRFRGVLAASSGLESGQFRELEWASGLRDATYMKVIRAHVDVAGLQARWPRSLHDALLDAVARPGSDPLAALVDLYRAPAQAPQLFALAEALSEYETRFLGWRFHHLQVVERAIGGRSAGTAGSSGGAYLGRTLAYRFFPELWAARNELSAHTARRPAPPPAK